MKLKPLMWVALCGGLLSCVHRPTDEDPLKNTKKLVMEGHSTLYSNGAFQVPMTTIHLIPPSPDALDLAMEMGGLRAAQSFRESVKHAREAAGLAKAGIEKSVAAGAAIREGTKTTAAAARDLTRFGARVTAKAPGVATSVVGASVSYAGDSYSAVRDVGRELANGSVDAAATVNQATNQAAGALAAGTVSVAKHLSQGSYAASRRHASSAKDRFIKGYAAVPAKLRDRAGHVAESASLNKFVDAFQRSDEWRSTKSHTFTDILVNTTGSYGRDVKKSFRAAADEITQGSQDTGYTLATLKSLRWVLQGLFWDAAIKPVGKIAGASLGYVTVNAVAFPALVTMREGVAVANVAVQVAWNGAAGAYDVTAPTATAAVAGLFSAVELVGGQAMAGTELVAGSVGTGAVYATGKTTAAATAATGYVAGKTVQYVAAPLSTVGVGAGGTVMGVVAGAGTAAAGVTMAATGTVGEAATHVVGNTAAGVAAVGGSVVSVAAGTALGTYELGKAVVVPSGYEVGAGVVVSYGTLSQLGAQTVLAVSDASYMVLSLEGPRWVLYAVKGKVNNGEQLPTGAVLDLKAMQKAGETLYVVPASEDEMNRVVNSVYDELPVRPSGATSDRPAEGPSDQR
jgi:hypothetical protein